MDQNFDNQNPAGDGNLHEPQPPKAPTPLYSNQGQTPPPPAAEPASQQAPQYSQQPQGQIPPISPEVPVEAPNQDMKMWGMFCHLASLAMFTSIPFANIIGPLIIWLIKKDESPFVDDQGKESVNFQISISIYLIACIPLCFIFIGIPLMIGLGVFNLVMIIIASIQANKGEKYRYPINLRIIK